MNCIENKHIRKGWDFEHYHQDFKLMPTEEIIRGKFEVKSNRSYIFVARHENLYELTDTCEHEDIHAVIDHIMMDDNLLIDIDMEHWAIRQMMWSEESL